MPTLGILGNYKLLADSSHDDAALGMTPLKLQTQAPSTRAEYALARDDNLIQADKSVRPT
jgi:hypothetical protein